MYLDLTAVFGTDNDHTQHIINEADLSFVFEEIRCSRLDCLADKQAIA